MFKNTKSKVYYYFFFFTFLAILPMPRNLQYVASIFKLGSSTFSLRKISNPFFDAFLIASYFCNFTLLAPRSFSFDCKSFSLFFFSSGEGNLGHTKKWSNILAGGALIEFLRAFNLIFKDLSECWCFAAEMVTMFDV